MSYYFYLSEFICLLIFDALPIAAIGKFPTRSN